LTVEYTTGRLSEAAFLVTMGHRLLSVDRDPTAGERWKLFVFDNTAREDGARYHAGASVEARAFARHLTDLKALLYPRALRQS
jgi:hypothetical protein